MNPLPDNLHLNGVTGSPTIPAEGLLHPENNSGPRIALHPGCGLVRLQALHGLAVNAHNLIAAAQSGISGRRSRIRLIDNHIALSIRLIDNCAYATIGFANHKLEVLILLLRNIHGIRIE